MKNCGLRLNFAPAPGIRIVAVGRRGVWPREDHAALASRLPGMV
jgi:hypothetical protein